MTEKIKYENWDFENPAEFTADFIANGFKALSRSGTTDEQVCIIALDMLDMATLDRLKSDPRFHIKVNLKKRVQFPTSNQKSTTILKLRQANNPESTTKLAYIRELAPIV